MLDANIWRACMRTIYQQTFYNVYHRTFDVVKADTDVLRRVVFNLRYKVFCVENGLDLQHGDGLEADAYDERAAHFLLVHKESGAAAGTVRVVLPDIDRPLFSFPLQELSDHPFLHNEDAPLNLCEISRLCMARDFRRRTRDGTFLPAYYEQEETGKPGSLSLTYLRRRIPYAPLGLFREAFATALDAGILNCVSIMDPQQFQSLRRLGVDYRILGPRLKQFGDQQPIVFNIKHVLDKMAAHNEVCWEIVSDQGALARKANKLSHYEWHDNLFDSEIHHEIYRKLF